MTKRLAKRPLVRKKTRKELRDPELAQLSRQQYVIRQRAHAACRLLKRRQEFILNIADNAWVEGLSAQADMAAIMKEARKWAALRRQFLAEATDPLELHFFASRWNCSRGSKPIYQIVTNPHCDAGTALWLYWENDPYFYQGYKNARDAEGPEEKAWLRILRAIERRFRRDDFASASIPFDPAPWVSTKDAEAEWAVHPIPAVMHQAVRGRTRRS